MHVIFKLCHYDNSTLSEVKHFLSFNLNTSQEWWKVNTKLLQTNHQNSYSVRVARDERKWIHLYLFLTLFTQKYTIFLFPVYVT